MTSKSIKLLSLVLAVMMLFSVLPMTAYAAETDAAETGVGGDIGDCTWTYNTYSNTLTISGSGEMPYDEDTMRFGDCPWESYKASIQKVVIGNSVKNITPYSFYQCRNLTEVTIGTSVEDIGAWAFAMTDLYDLYLPDSVKYIQRAAFEHNKNLSHVRMSHSIELIAQESFHNSDISYVYIPKKDVDFVGDNNGEYQAFGTKIKFDPEGDSDPVTVYIEGFTIAGYPGGSVQAEIENNYYGYRYHNWKFVATSGKTGACDWDFDPETGTLTISGNGKMKDYLFVDGEEQYVQDTPWKDFSDEIKKVVIEDGVENVGDYAFPNCYNLEEIEIGNDVTYIGECAFYAALQVTDLYIPDSVTSIGENAFASSYHLSNVRMSKNINYIGNRAFLDTALTSIVIPTWMPQLGRDCIGFIDDGTPADDFTIYGLELSSAYEYADEHGFKFVAIGDRAGTWYFDVETRELSINIDGAMADYTYMNPAPWSPLYTYDPDDRWTLTFIGNTTHIGDYAFYHLPIKGSVMLPYTCTSVGQSAFYGCEYMDSVYLDNVETIEAQAFSYCKALTNVNLDAAKTIGESAFASCWDLNTVMFGSNLTDIGDGAFQSCDLTTLTIPAAVETIGESAFSGNYNLESVLFADNAKLRTIGAHAFQYSRKLSEIRIPDSVTEIGNYAFAEIKTLQNLTLGYSVQTIGGYAFYETDVHEVKCPASMQTIGTRAFGYKENESNPDYFDTTGRFDFYGPTGSPAKAYADQEADFYFHEIAVQTLEDEATGIQVDTTDDGVELVVEEKEKGSIAIVVDGVIVGVYDITLEKDGNAVQPEEPVTVRIPCEYYGATVYRVEADGSLTNMNATSEFGYVEFTTDHFSLYLLTKSVDYYLGDVDWDGSVNSIDVTKIQRKLANMQFGPNDPYNKEAADVNEDGSVDIIDVTLIQRYLAKMDTGYPIGEAR